VELGVETVPNEGTSATFETAGEAGFISTTVCLGGFEFAIEERSAAATATGIVLVERKDSMEVAETDSTTWGWCRPTIRPAAKKMVQMIRPTKKISTSFQLSRISSFLELLDSESSACCSSCLTLRALLN
jgi:hypothetical protein